MLASHYAPRAPLRLRAAGEAWPTDPRLGVLAFQCGRGGGAEEVLSPSGDLTEAAARLFAALRRLDAAGVGGIVAELVPEQGLGEAINDRLRRAAGLG
jgi:L-threonylcarbamoyladenylate synthase